MNVSYLRVDSYFLIACFGALQLEIIIPSQNTPPRLQSPHFCDPSLMTALLKSVPNSTITNIILRTLRSYNVIESFHYYP